MRKTIYYPNYGYVTEYEGYGIWSDIFSKVGELVTSKPVREAGVEGSKAIAKSFGGKAGSKLADKLMTKKSTSISISETDKPLKTDKPKPTKLASDLLNEIYGSSIFRGKGIKRI